MSAPLELISVQVDDDGLVAWVKVGESPSLRPMRLPDTKLADILKLLAQQMIRTKERR